MQAVKNDNRTAVEQLIDCGVSANAIGARNEQAIVAAAEIGNFDITELLLKNGAKVDERSRDALYKASSCGHTSVVALILKEGAEIYQGYETIKPALEAAASNGHMSTVNLLLLLIGGNEKRKARNDVLWNSVSNGHRALADLMQEQGAAVFHYHQQFLDRALGEAVDSGNEAAVTLLIDTGANVNATIITKIDRPLKRAAERRNRPIAELLLRAGASRRAVSGEREQRFLSSI